MMQQTPVLDYERAPPKRSAAALVTPTNVAITGAIVAFVSLLAPFDIGSGRVVVNPLRVIGCGVAVVCAVLYALLRLWQDTAASAARRVVLSLSLLLAVWSFVMAHLSVWGRTRLPPFEMRSEYWRWMMMTAAAVLLAIVFCGVGAAVRLMRKGS